MMVIGVTVFGWISYQQLPLNLMPDISYPSLTIRTEYPGSAPEEVETTITRPVEEALGVVDNLVRISSISKAERSDVILEYNWDTDMNLATSEVREKLDHVFLPEEAKRPLILRYDPSLDPILRLGVYGEQALSYLRYIAETDIKRALETIDGVAAVKVKGGLEEEIRVELNENELTLIGINIEQVHARLSQENINLAGGNLKEGQTEYIVRTLNEFRSVDEIGDVVIGTWNGREIKVKDIATVTRTTKERDVITRINGHESVEIEIFKEADANIVSVAKQVGSRVFGTPEQQMFVANMKKQAEAAPADSTQTKAEESNKKDADKKKGGPRGGPGGDFMLKKMTNFIGYTLPEGIHIEKLSDQSVFIESSIKSVKNTAVMGGILAVLVLFIFLRKLPPTLIIGVSIPVSVVATFVPMKLFNVSLNIMSLGGLALGIGMLVDNSIVVLESITRCREEGDDLYAAINRGVSEVSGAVTASTLTTVAVFFPIVFVEGVAGQIFGDLSLAVVFSLLASLLVALFVIPMLTARENLLQTAKDPSAAHGFNLLEFHSLAAAKADFSGFGAWYKQSLTAKILTPGLIFVLLFYVFKFVIFLVFEILFRVIHAIGILGGFAVKGLLFVSKNYIGPAVQFLVNLINGIYEKIANRYPAILTASLNHRGTVLILTAILFAVSVFLIGPRLGSELIPTVHQGEFNVEVTLPVGTPIEQTDARLTEIEALIRSEAGVQSVAGVIGADQTSNASSEEGEHTAKLTVAMTRQGNMIAAEEELIDRIRAKLHDFSGITIKISRPVLFSFKTPIEIEIQGYSLPNLQEVGQRVMDRMENIPGLFDVKSTMQRGNPEVQIVYDRQQLARSGLNVSQVAAIVRTKVLGEVATEFKEEDRKIDIRVRLRDEDTQSIEDLKRLIINPGSARPIPLEAVADIRINEGPSEIRRVEQQRTCLITANVSGRDLRSVSEELFGVLNQTEMPDDFTFTIAGQNKEMETSLNSLIMALTLAIFLVYIVMASQFESLVHPFVIIFTIPLALIGVILILFALDIPVSIVVFLGMIVLVGIVVNNAIVLVDYINQMRDKGLDKTAAIIEAGKARLRPIVMTTATTVLGLLPMALGFGDGTEIRTPMAITVIVGLITSSILTLIIIPTVYSLVDWKK